ncbi:DUF3027 domain-containing protein [Pseudarthrobacter sp. J64]|uniref:DUF3027 domain-containing protein n=1 Tax=Pseudarthrobacter sp. J64 TaxID=3116485 RepID=UPI002E80CD43|nr:DUF3027 domain-containing protein [Pseudarthrobacter sp. J64]MEE2569846.1 DUF3027 domain-containing protein [Pseudarthrobacter sp. J64]
MNAEAEEPVKTPPRRAGVPVWRTGKPDAVLAAAVDAAREAVQSIASPSDVGTHVGARTEGDRVVTHLFECRLPGYPGWQWFAVLTRNSRSKVITVNEVGLLPSEASVLAPEWVPWAERVRPEDAQPEETPEEPASLEAPGDSEASDGEAAADADVDADADADSDANGAAPAQGPDDAVEH